MQSIDNHIVLEARDQCTFIKFTNKNVIKCIKNKTIISEKQRKLSKFIYTRVATIFRFCKHKSKTTHLVGYTITKN